MAAAPLGSWGSATGTSFRVWAPHATALRVLSQRGAAAVGRNAPNNVRGVDAFGRSLGGLRTGYFGTNDNSNAGIVQPQHLGKPYR